MLSMYIKDNVHNIKYSTNVEDNFKDIGKVKRIETCSKINEVLLFNPLPISN